PLGAGQGAAGRRDVRRELRGPGARPLPDRRPGPGRGRDRPLPRAAGRDDADLPPAVARHGPGAGPALDPAPRHEGAAEVLLGWTAGAPADLGNLGQIEQIPRATRGPLGTLERVEVHHEDTGLPDAQLR